MSCYGPVVGYYGAKPDKVTGIRPIVFDERQAHSGVPIRIPCGKCIGCLKERAFQWKVRCVHEMRMFSDSAFVTLTYSEKELPANASLEKRAVQLFMKRLRERREIGVRFFACGEYGETFLRPHYHILLFNVGFPDKYPWRKSKMGHQLFRSPELESLWKFGSSEIGEVNAASIGYCVNYMVKGISRVKDFYVNRIPEFQLMSRNPGLGTLWFNEYGRESYRHDDCVIDGERVRLPRFYDRKFGEANPEQFELLRRARRLRAQSESARNERTRERRLVREKLDYLLIERYARET